MATEKEKIVRRISELERIVTESNAEIEHLTNTLRETPAALLERDKEADIKARAERLNAHLRKNGLLP